jgi:hypothetical protein
VAHCRLEGSPTGPFSAIGARPRRENEAGFNRPLRCVGGADKAAAEIQGDGAAAALEKCRALADTPAKNATAGGVREAKEAQRRTLVAKKTVEVEKSTHRLKNLLDPPRRRAKKLATMVLEWIRRRDPVMDNELRDSLFKTGEIGQG